MFDHHTSSHFSNARSGLLHLSFIVLQAGLYMTQSLTSYIYFLTSWTLHDPVSYIMYLFSYNLSITISSLLHPAVNCYVVSLNYNQVTQFGQILRFLSCRLMSSVSWRLLTSYMRWVKFRSHSCSIFRWSMVSVLRLVKVWDLLGM